MKIDYPTSVGMLRQWLNESKIKDAKNFVTNEDLHHWLDRSVEIMALEQEVDTLIWATGGIKEFTEGGQEAINGKIQDLTEKIRRLE